MPHIKYIIKQTKESYSELYSGIRSNDDYIITHIIKNRKMYQLLKIAVNKTQIDIGCVLRNYLNFNKPHRYLPKSIQAHINQHKKYNNLHKKYDDLRRRMKRRTELKKLISNLELPRHLVNNIFKYIGYDLVESSTVTKYIKLY